MGSWSSKKHTKLSRPTGHRRLEVGQQSQRWLVPVTVAVMVPLPDWMGACCWPGGRVSHKPVADPCLLLAFLLERGMGGTRRLFQCKSDHSASIQLPSSELALYRPEMSEIGQVQQGVL